MVAAGLTGNSKAFENSSQALTNAAGAVVHSPAANFVGTNIVKPVLQFPVDASSQIYNNAVAPVLNTPQFNNAQQVPGLSGKIARKVGATGSLHQTVGSGIQTALTIGSGGIGNAIERMGGKAGALAPRVISNAAITGGFGGASAAGQGASPTQIAEATGAGAALGGALPITGTLLRKGAGATLDKVEQARPPVSSGVPKPTEAVQPPETATPTAEPTPTVPKTKQPFTVPTSTPEATAQAAQRLANLYNEDSAVADSGQGLLAKAKGNGVRFSIAGNKLEKAMASDLTPEERVAVRDGLEGVPHPSSSNPRVNAVTNVMRQLNEYGYSVLDKTTPSGIGRVAQYATRLANFATRPGNEGVGVVGRGINSLQDLLDVHSKFGTQRQVGKFIGSDGEVRYGTQGDANLTKNAEDQLTSGGKVFKAVPVSTRELQEQGFNYEDNYGKIANVYHSSVGRAKAADDAVQELLRDPARYGLSTEQGRGMQPITKVDELKGYFAPRSLANDIDEQFGFQKTPGLAERGYQGTVHAIVQTIVYNPLFHGRNLNELAGLAAGKVKGPFGPAMLKKAYGDLATMGSEDRAALYDRMLKGGVIKETYGADRETVLSNALDKVNLPHINKANARAMSKIDWSIRSGLFHLVTSGENAMSDEEGAKLVNNFLGDGRNGGPISRNVGMFWGYLRTRGRVLGQTVAHPLENKGVAIAYAEQAAVLYGVTKALIAITGNKNATAGHPGEFGLVKEANNLRQGRLGSVVAQNVNPLITAGINQATGKDLYSGQTIPRGGRVANARDTLLGPSQYTTKIASGKASAPQEILQAVTGINLPHVKGAPAAPNFKSGPLSSLNTKGAKAVPNEGNIHDPTGIAQASKWYNAVNKGMASIPTSDTYGQSVLTKVLARSHDPSNGETIILGVKEQKSNGADLYSSPSALKAYISAEKAQPSHNPIFDHSFKDVQVYEKYQSLDDEDPERNVLEQKNPQLITMFQQEQQYYTKLAQSPNGERPADFVPYPNLTPQQAQQMGQVFQLSALSSRTPDQTKQLQTLERNADTQAAFALMDAYHNQRRVINGASPIPYPSTESPQVAAGWQAYDALSQHNGKYGGSPDRAAWIKANQGLWSQMQSAAAQDTYFAIEKQGAIGYVGGTPNASFLKDIKNEGRDIATTTNADGTISYKIDPAAAFAQGSGGGSSGSSALLSKVLAEQKLATQNRDAEKASKGLKRGGHKVYGRTRTSKISIKGTPKVRLNKIQLPGVNRSYTPKIKLKPSSNKVRLKVH